MTNRETATIELPLRVWGRVATEAEHRGVSVEDIYVAAIESIIAPLDRREAILRLVHMGMDDGAVSRRLGETRQYVADVRRKAGILRNRVKYPTERKAS